MKEKKGMPVVPHEVLITNPTHDLHELQMEINDKLEGCMQDIVNSVDLYYDSKEGWFAVIWYKII